ncbi:MAG: hypothetical protein NW226_05960 [Microscillaceae bacterium]|nr:hypothetical protein [Microscillaceae bacterium]
MNNMLYFSFSEWLASKRAISFTLAIGVIFLIGCYTKIIHVTNPDAEQFAYWQWVIITLSHVDALFFGLCTIVLMYQASKNWHKILFCSFEGSMIFLYVNQNFLAEMGFDPSLFLGIYLGLFGGFAMYFLGSLSRSHRLNAQPTKQVKMPKENTQEFSKPPVLGNIQPDDLPMNKSQKEVFISGLKRYEHDPEKVINQEAKSEKVRSPKAYGKLARLFEKGYSINEAARRANVSWKTAKKAKEFYTNSMN